MDRTGPLVAVCVAPADLRPEVDDLTGAVRADRRRADLSAAEAAAVEHGLRVAEAWGGWLLVVAAGPPEIDAVLADLVALGSEVCRIETGHSARPAAFGPEPVGGRDVAGDPAAVAAALARAIRRHGSPSLVICGDRSAAHGVGAVPAFLAEHLDLDQALGLVSLSVTGPGSLEAERRLDGGWRDRLEISGPAVVSVEAAGVRLRRAPLAAALAAPRHVPWEATSSAGTDSAGRETTATGSATTATGSVGAGEGEARTGEADVTYGATRPYRPRTRLVPAPAGDAHHRLLALTGALTTREPVRVVGPLTPAEAVDELFAYLRRYGFIESD